jgi:catechol 2,3-dioxygenase-like lactoylglutathione lyase family enzyme
MLQRLMPTLTVRDMDATVRFYTDVLGLQLKENWGTWAELVSPDGTVIGVYREPELARGTSGSMSIGWGVPDLDRAMEELGARGVTFVGPVQDFYAIRMAHFHDPEGHALYIAAHK